MLYCDTTQRYFAVKFVEGWDCPLYGVGITVKSRYLEVDGTIFNKFILPEVQINLHFG